MLDHYQQTKNLLVGEKPIGFHMSASQFEYWKHTHLTVDVVAGRGSGCSVEAPEGVRFIQSRLPTDDEVRDLRDRRPVPE